MALAQFGNVVGGASHAAAPGRRLVSLDPVTGEPWAEAPDSDEADVGAAVTAAAAAFATWRRTMPRERMDALLAAADVLAAHADELAALEVRDTGKPLRSVVEDEIPPTLDQLRFFAGAARLLEGRAVAEYEPGRDLRRASRADRRLRRHHPVELPADDGGLEVGSRGRGGQRRRAQAVGAHAGVDGADGRAARRRTAGRGAQRGLRRSGDRPCAGVAPAGRPGLADRQRPRRPGSRRSRGRAARAHPPRARRQRTGRGPGGRRPRRLRPRASPPGRTSTPARTAPPPPACSSPGRPPPSWSSTCAPRPTRRWPADPSCPTPRTGRW